MKHIVTVTALLLTLCVSAAQAAVFDNPQSAVITPKGARLTVVSHAAANVVDGHAQVDVYLPPKATLASLDITAPTGISVLRWSVDKVSLPAQDASAAGQSHQTLLEQRDLLTSEIAVLTVRQELWCSVPTDWPQEQLDAREARVATVLPQILVELARKQRELTALEERIKALPDATHNAQRVRVMLAGAVKQGANISLHYTYALDNCTWQPSYRINAGKDGISVALEAAVEQHSGFDWNNTKVTLSLQSTMDRHPAPITPWVIRKISSNDLSLMRTGAAPRHATMMDKSRVSEADAAPAATPFTSEYGAGWQLDQSTRVPEGVSYLPIMEEIWTDKLQRIARPARGDDRVWLTAEHVFTGTPLPPGRAAYMLDGSPVGQGSFAPKGNKVSLAFGVDPLCSVRTEKDTRTTGSTGIIDRKQTWRWGWTFSALNNRDKEVVIRIEDADPQASDTNIKVTLEDDPIAAKGENHTIFWNVTVPPKASATVRHSVRVEAPKDMSVNAVR